MATTDRPLVKRPPGGRLSLNRPRSIPRDLIEFQPDVVEIERRSVPGGARWTLYAVIAFIVTAVAWACWAKVDRIVVASGSLTTQESAIVIQPAATAPIRQFLVRFGDFVQPGQLLATLDPTFSAADLAILQSRQLRSTPISRGSTPNAPASRSPSPIRSPLPPGSSRAQAWHDRRAEYDAKMATFDAEERKFQSQQATNEHAIDSLRRQLEITLEFYETLRGLQEKRIESKLELWRAEISKQDAERELEQALGQRDQLVQDLELNRKRREEYAAQFLAKISDELLAAEKELSQVAEELTKAQRMNELIELRVPNDLPHGEYYVQEVADLSVGSVVKPSESLFKLIPVNVPLEAEIEILARDIGLIDADQNVRIKLDAFPYQKHGTIDGRLRTVSEGTFQKGEPPAVQTLYRARVRLGTTDSLTNLPDGFRLLPGMNIAAEIRVGQRRVIEYFLYPLLRHLDSSIREP